MMHFQDPLQTWLWMKKEKLPRKEYDRALINVRGSLERLARLLDSTPLTRHPSYNGLGLLGSRWMHVALPGPDVSPAHALYRRVVERGGGGSSVMQEALLDIIGISADPSSVTFWSEMIDLRRARDSFSQRRLTYALAALALLIVLGRGEDAALDALRRAMKNDRAECRAMAAHYLGRAFMEARRPVHDDVMSALEELAARDKAFEPRFMARMALWSLGRPPAVEFKGSVFSLKVWHERDECVLRVIEISPENTLDDLHLAIQKAWRWDADHLYAFYLNGKLHDSRFEFAHAEVEDAAGYASDAKLGELGLRPGDKFIYLFDFGDDHVFRIVMTGVRPRARQTKLPRIVESLGRAMPQYPGWE